jgi:threonine/homoserine/homoserine lactone efflux protein
MGTSVPVIVVGVPLALGVMQFAAWFNLLARIERVMRRVAAFTFIGAGTFMLWNWAAAAWV